MSIGREVMLDEFQKSLSNRCVFLEKMTNDLEDQYDKTRVMCHEKEQYLKNEVDAVRRLVNTLREACRLEGERIVGLREEVDSLARKMKRISNLLAKPLEVYEKPKKRKTVRM